MCLIKSQVKGTLMKWCRDLEAEGKLQINVP